MKFRSVLLLLALLAIPLTSTTNSFAASKPAPAEEDAAADEKDGKKNTTVLIVEAPADKVHAAALEALASIGCKVKKDSSSQIEAKRPNKVGLAVGSGGEKLFVWIKELGDGKTELKVTTKKTFAGIVGQKLWNEEVAHHIKDALK